MVWTAADAQHIFHAIEAEHHTNATMLQCALAQVQDAVCQVQNAEDKLAQMDVHIGKVRWVIKRCGFGKVMKPQFQKKLPQVVQHQSKCIYIKPEGHSIYSAEQHVVLVLEGHMSVTLD